MPDHDTSSPKLPAGVTMTEEAARTARELRRVVIATDDRADCAVERVRRAATQLALEHEWQLVLYDRSHERWTDTPHPKGPVHAGELEGDDWEHLRVQLDDISAAGIDVAAWLATVPSITAMLDVLQEMDVDGVFLPAELDHPKLMDRLLEGDDVATMVERVAALQLDTPPRFLQLDGDVIRTAEYAG